ncbi:Uu.00g117460.m01.CDS01 [Anthostomella pinea]|uniref:Uu.00g117460.m01.CDS01 n=1 Tax=Anthostomella pinea TaxID=933095 RepID=A0AAI8YH27_9PEZI|nr:Uu.00g117460.m01.CDS01 [Anthostomella pinea]
MSRPLFKRFTWSRDSSQAQGSRPPHTDPQQRISRSNTDDIFKRDGSLVPVRVKAYNLPCPVFVNYIETKFQMELKEFNKKGIKDDYYVLQLPRDLSKAERQEIDKLRIVDPKEEKRQKERKPKTHSRSKSSDSE